MTRDTVTASPALPRNQNNVILSIKLRRKLHWW